MNLRLEGIRLPLAHFTLDVEATLSARVTALFGPSGAGKTSLLELIAGLRRPTAGRITLDGTVLSDDRLFVAPEHRGIGYLPQDDALFPHLSVRQNLLYGFGSRQPRPAELSFDHVAAVLEIGHLDERRIGTLSGGERQRVALGRALLGAPRVLLLDEPLARLDQALKERLLPYLRRVREEFAIPFLYVTHAPDEVMALCDEVLVIENGRRQRQGAVADLFVASGRQCHELRREPPAAF